MYNKLILLLGVCMFGSTMTLIASEVEAPEFERTRYYDSFTLSYKDGDDLYNTMISTINGLNPNVGGEISYEFTIPEYLLKDLDEDSIDRIMYHAVSAFSTLEGIEYYSYRRKQYREFIETSYSIASLEDRTPQDDWVPAENQALPPFKSTYVFQKDSSFGGGVKQVAFTYDKNNHQILIHIINEDTIFYKDFINVAKPHTSIVNFIVTRDGNVIKVQGAVGMHMNSFKFMWERSTYSMIFRAFALIQWVENNMLDFLSSD